MPELSPLTFPSWSGVAPAPWSSDERCILIRALSTTLSGFPPPEGCGFGRGLGTTAGGVGTGGGCAGCAGCEALRGTGRGVAGCGGSGAGSGSASTSSAASGTAGGGATTTGVGTAGRALTDDARARGLGTAFSPESGPAGESEATKGDRCAGAGVGVGLDRRAVRGDLTGVATTASSPPPTASPAASGGSCR